MEKLTIEQIDALLNEVSTMAMRLNRNTTIRERMEQLVEEVKAHRGIKPKLKVFSCGTSSGP
jgi:hypothetical protein